MNYYDEVLIIREEHSCIDEIIDFIRNSIKNDKYIIVYVDLGAIHGVKKDTFHEIFIFGYNNKNSTFQTSIVSNEGNKWIESSIPYSRFKDAYTLFYEYISENKEQFYQKYGDYNYAITSLKLKHEYYAGEFDMHHFYSDMCAYYWGGEYERKYLDENGTIITSKIFKNTSVYLGFLEYLNKFIAGDDEPCMGYVERAKFFKKMHEVKLMLKDKLLLIHQRCFAISDDVFLKLESLISQLNQNVMRAIKYEYTGDIKIVNTIRDTMYELYKLDREILYILLGDIKTNGDIKWFYKLSKE